MMESPHRITEMLIRDDQDREALLAEVQRQFGWAFWQDDPWQGTRNFVSWLEEAPDSMSTVVAVNETKGRYYLAKLIRNRLEAQDYSDKNPEDLAELVGTGGLVELEVARHGGVLDYPAKGFPYGFLNTFAEHFKDRPFAPYIECVRAVFRGEKALKAMKLAEHPEVGGLIDHTITNSPRSHQLQDMWGALHPETPLPTAGDGWEMMGLGKPLSGLGLKYKDPFRGDTEEPKQQATSEVLAIIAAEMEKRPEKLIGIGVRGELIPYLAKATQNKMNTWIGKLRNHTNREEFGLDLAEISEGRGVLGDKDQDQGLKDLDLDWDSLTPREVMLLQDIQQALDLGYSFNSKKGKSMRQYWPEEVYSGNRKAFERLRHKLKKNLSK